MIKVWIENMRSNEKRIGKKGKKSIANNVGQRDKCDRFPRQFHNELSRHKMSEPLSKLGLMKLTLSVYV